MEYSQDESHPLLILVSSDQATTELKHTAEQLQQQPECWNTITESHLIFFLMLIIFFL